MGRTGLQQIAPTERCGGVAIVLQSVSQEIPRVMPTDLMPSTPCHPPYLRHRNESFNCEITFQRTATYSAYSVKSNNTDNSAASLATALPT